MYKVIPLVFTFYCWSVVVLLVSTHYSRAAADYCGKSQGFANHRQQGRLGSLFHSFFNLPQLQNVRQPKIIDGTLSKKESWPWQVSAFQYYLRFKRFAKPLFNSHEIVIQLLPHWSKKPLFIQNFPGKRVL